MPKTLEKKTEKQEEKSKPQEQKKKKKGVSPLYKVQDGEIIRLRPTCERCGPGYFMADHGNRYACGRCGFTRYKPVEDKK
jgi:small subunit ribosomal protein S27Ae